MRLGWSSLVLAGLSTVIQGSQIPFSNGAAFAPAGTDGIVPTNLSSISDSFTVFSHPNFPAQQLRIKRTHFCDRTVKVWTGSTQDPGRVAPLLTLSCRLY